MSNKVLNRNKPEFLQVRRFFVLCCLIFTYLVYQHINCLPVGDLSNQMCVWMSGIEGVDQEGAVKDAKKK